MNTYILQHTLWPCLFFLYLLPLEITAQYDISIDITNPSTVNPNGGEILLQFDNVGEGQEQNLPPFTIQWIQSETIIQELELNTAPWEANINALSVGEYCVKITTASGCVAEDCFELSCTFNSYAPLTQVDCENSGSGRLGINAVGLDYEWTDAFGNYLGTESVLEVGSAGTYQVEMTNPAGCTAFETFDFFPEDIKPYIKKVKITSNGVTIYDATWQRTGENCIIYTGGMIAMSETVLIHLLESSISVEVQASEALQGLDLSLNGMIEGIGLPSNNHINWQFNFGTGVLNDISNSDNFELRLIFQGKDHQGNQLLALRELSDDLVDCVKVPEKWTNCDWTPMSNGGKDDSHALSISCISADYTVSIENGSIQVTITGGEAPYQISLIGEQQQYEGETSELSNTYTFTNVEAGLYEVFIKSKDGCSLEDRISMCKTLEAEVRIESPCGHQYNGEVCISVNSTAAIIRWEDGYIGACRNNLEASQYTVVISEALCEQSLTVDDIVVESSSGTWQEPIITETTATCADQSMGGICIEAQGATPPYQYEWETGTTGNCLSEVTAGTWSIKITDACGISLVRSFEVPTSNPEINKADIQDACEGTANGAIELIMVGGVEPYNFKWTDENGQEVNPQQLEAGTYTVVITDACGEMLTTTYTVGSFESIGFFNAQSTDIAAVCGTADQTGHIEIEVTTTSTIPNTYTFEWSNGATTQNIDDLGAGTYTVTVTNQEGCESINPFIVPIVPPPFEIQATSIRGLCAFGTSTGHVEIEVVSTDGVPDTYTFEWSNGATTQNIYNLSADTYTVTVSNEDGCELVNSFTISTTLLNLDGDTFDPCSGSNGEIDLVVIAGTPPYSFDWSNGANTEDLIDLSAGLYQVTVTDANGCTRIRTFELFDNSIQLTIDNIRVNTYSGNPDLGIEGNGSIRISVTGLYPPFSFEWSNGETTEDNFQLGAGVYSVIVTDATGCSIVEFFTIEDCGGNGILSAYISPLDVDLCTNENGAMTVTVNSGEEPYIFEWSGPNNYTNGENVATITELPDAGIYTVTVTDDCGQESIASFDLTCDDLCDFSGRFETKDECINQWLVQSKIKLKRINTNSNNIERIYIHWLNSDYEILDVGIIENIDPNDHTGKNYDLVSGVDVLDIDTPGEYHVVLTDETACENIQSFTFFNALRINGPHHEVVTEVIPDFYDENFRVQTGCFECRSCNAEDEQSCDPWAGISANYQSEDYRYVTEDYRNPCKEGKIICPIDSEFDLEVNDVFGVATAIVDRSESIGETEDGLCIYECGCYYPAGSIEGADWAVYVTTEIHEKCDEEEEEEEDCPNTINVSNFDNCRFDEVCVTTGELISEGEDLTALCYIPDPNSNEWCDLYEYCPFSSLSSSNSNTYIRSFICENEEHESCSNPFNQDGNSSYRTLHENTYHPIYQIDKVTSLIKDNWITKIYPNPFTNILNLNIISLQETNVQLIIYDVLGNPVWTDQQSILKGSQNFQLHLDNDMPNGIYQLAISNEKGQVSIHKIVKFDK